MKNINKLFATLFTVMFIMTGVALADQPSNPGPGYYVKENGATAGTVKYFPNGQPENQSEWRFCGTDANSCNPTPPPCNGPGCYSNGYYRNFAFSIDQSAAGSWKDSLSFSVSGDDSAYAGARGAAQGGYSAYAGGKGFFMGNYAAGSEDTASDSTAGTYAFDLGKTSMTGGFAEQNSSADADAFALGGGIGKGMAWTQTYGNVNGFVEQTNRSNEGDVGAPTGTWSTAGNGSFAGYMGSAYDADCYKGPIVWASKSDIDVAGSAFTQGHSFAAIDDVGPFRSSYGTTWNEARSNVTGADWSETPVGGGGDVAVRTGIGMPGQGAKAEGLSQFGYIGSDYGKGGAEHGSYATMGSDGPTNFSKSGSAGAAFSFVKGPEVQNRP